MKSLLLWVVLFAIAVAPVGAAPVLRNPLPVAYGGTSAADDIVAADFNGDGHDDVLAMVSSGALHVLLSNGGGPFGAPQITTVSGALAAGRPGIGDVNGDGKLDAVLSDRNTREIVPMLGNGDGTFTRGSSFFLATTLPDTVAVARFNADAFLDLAVASYDSPNGDYIISIHYGNGAGQFSAGPATLIERDSIYSLLPTDLNGDGVTDLIASGSFDTHVLTGYVGGSFVRTDVTADGGVAVADFNHDGKPDVAVADGGTHDWNVVVALGNGDGTLQPPVRYVAAYGGDSIAAADLDNDGNVDLVSGSSDTVTVLHGNANGTFDPPIFFMVGPSAWKIAVSDFDRDGAEDLVTLGSVELRALSFVRGRGDGTFHAYRSFHTNAVVPVSYPGLSTGAPRVGDMNEDGRLDVVVINQQAGTVLGPFELSVMLNDGSGVLASPIRTSTQSDGWDWDPQFDLGDLNGDGWLDTVVTSNLGYDPRAVSMLGNGDGTFDAPVEVPIALFGFPKLGHFNGDAHLDLMLAGGLDHASVYPGNGDGTFGAEIRSQIPSRETLFGDLNNDGRMDYVNGSLYRIVAAVNDGTGRFTAVPVTSEEIEGDALADFDGDGKLDLLITTYSGIQTRFGNGDGTFGSPVIFTVRPVPGYPSREPVTTSDYDGDGKIDVSFGTSRIYLSNGDGTFRSRADFPLYADYTAVGDLDGNDSPDLVTVDRSGDDVAVLVTRTTADPTATPVVSLSANKSTAQYAENVTFEATVAGSGVPLRGVVVFSYGEKAVALIEVDAEGKATYTGAFPTGSYQITARYTGDENYREATDSVGLTVTKARPDISYEVYSNPSTYGSGFRIWVSLTAPRSVGLAQPTGNITVREGQTQIGAPIDPNVVGYVNGSGSTPVGSHLIHLEYPGDANYEAVTESYTQEVVKSTPGIFLTTNPPADSLVAGNPVTLRVTMSSSVTGTVTIDVDDVHLATVALIGGAAEVGTTFQWGERRVRVRYSGDASRTPAERTSVLQVKIGPWGTPMQFTATGSSGGGVAVRWSQVLGVASYKLWRRTSPGAAWTLVNTYSQHVMTASVTMPANSGQLFAVSAVDANGAESPLSAPDLATAVSFTDPTIVPRVTRVKAAHLAELRAAIGYARAFAGLATFGYTNTVASGQRIRRVDLTETRTALAQARSTLGLPAIAFTDATPTSIRTVHVAELRAGVQ